LTSLPPFNRISSLYIEEVVFVILFENTSLPSFFPPPLPAPNKVKAKTKPLFPSFSLGMRSSFSPLSSSISSKSLSFLCRRANAPLSFLLPPSPRPGRPSPPPPQLRESFFLNSALFRPFFFFFFPAPEIKRPPLFPSLTYGMALDFDGKEADPPFPFSPLPESLLSERCPSNLLKIRRFFLFSPSSQGVIPFLDERSPSIPLDAHYSFSSFFRISVDFFFFPLNDNDFWRSLADRRFFSSPFIDSPLFLLFSPPWLA